MQIANEWSPILSRVRTTLLNSDASHLEVPRFDSMLADSKIWPTCLSRSNLRASTSPSLSSASSSKSLSPDDRTSTTSLTWLEMRRATARRAQLSTQEQKEHNLATMLLVVVLVFFICNLLPLVVNILELNSQNNQQLTKVSNFLVTINSSVNILIYCIFGKKFRTVFMQIFLGKEPPCILTSARSQYHHGKSTYTSNNVPTESMKLIFS